MKKLCVCFDGTWNSSQSGTNVYHLSNLIAEGRIAGPAGSNPPVWEQKVYYSEGVGTHAFDSVTGGAFGAGLSDIIRNAYDWLVENYDDGDEVYVIGFSRGAFTARSLIGLIAKCGLVRRGAPIPPEQLWAAYRVLGRWENPRTGAIPTENWWEMIFGRPVRPFRPIWVFHREAGDDPGPPNQVNASGRTERLLDQWSRRIPIKCVALYDTVGSLGVDAFAIPGLRSKSSQFHDTNLTYLCHNAFQALAIDEYRANFACIPWRVPVDESQGTRYPGGEFEQRWFIGAHSNVGGGYEDDQLAQYPLAWLLRRLGKLGLAFKPDQGNGGPPLPPPTADLSPLGAPDGAHVNVRTRLPTTLVALIPAGFMYLRLRSGQAHVVTTIFTAAAAVGGIAGANFMALKRSGFPQLRDSYAEFGYGLWKYFARSKPEYRTIGATECWENNVVVKPVTERVDASVGQVMMATNFEYNPPHLARDRSLIVGAGKLPADAPAPRFRYFQGGVGDAVMLAVWVTFLAIGIHHFVADAGDVRAPLGWVLALVIASPFVVIDWYESWLNFRAAARDGGIWNGMMSAVLNLFLVVRLVAVALVAIGLLRCLIPLPTHLPGWVFSPRCQLILMDFLLLVLCFAKEWCATSMIEAGIGPVSRLQTCYTPMRFQARMELWAPESRSAGNRRTDAERRSLLQPVMEALGRDMLGLVPTCTAINIFGLYLLKIALDATGWVAPLRGWLHDPGHLVIAREIILGGAIANLLGDALRMGWLLRVPRTPSWASLALGAILYWLKFAGFVFGLFCSLGAAVCLVAFVAQGLHLPDASYLIVSTLAFLPILFTIAHWLIRKRI